MTKVAVVTGGGRGIGRSVAIEFAKNGWDVAVIARSKNEIFETINLIRKTNPLTDCMAVTADVSNQVKIKHEFERILGRFGRIDALVNAAGVQGPIGKIQENNIKDWKKTIEVNLLGTVQCMQEAIKQMIVQKSGSIINFSGGGALGIRENFSAYSASKAAVIRLSEITAIEVRDFGVRINAISPGAVSTKMFEQMLAAGKEKVGDKEWELLLKQKENGGVGAIVAARLCIWLASSKSAPLTGKVVSAVNDKWRDWTKEDIEKLMQKEWYTMRRLDRNTINKLNEEKSS